MTSERHHKVAYFRQGGWMVLATTLTGVFMFAVHLFAPWLGDQEFGLFGTLLAMMNVMLIPALGLQTVFAHQTAAAASEDDQKRLAGTVQALLRGTFLIWLGMALAVFLFRRDVIDLFSIRNPAALWIVVVIGLLQLWLPILLGLMQGTQNFLWLGWVMILNGVVRFAAVGALVVILGYRAAGAVTGVLMGVVIAFSLAAFQSRRMWWRRGLPFHWRRWLPTVIPLTLGLGTSQFIFSADMIFVRALFGEDQTGYYSAAGMIGRGMVIFTLPLSVVMFPKIVQSISHGRKTNAFAFTLLATAILGILAAGAATGAAHGVGWLLETPGLSSGLLGAAAGFLAPFTQALTVIARLVPWFVWCMLPLCVANVMLNNLLARKQFQVVPWLILVVAGYAAALPFRAGSFESVIQTLGLFNLLFAAVLAWFTWRDWNRLRIPIAGKEESGGPA